MLIIDDSSPQDITFDQWGVVVVYDKTTHFDGTRRIIISKNTRVVWYAIHDASIDYSLDFETRSGESILRTLLLSSDNDFVRYNVSSRLSHSGTVSNIHILSLVWESGIIELNGTVIIDPDIWWVKWHILEENIFLWEKGSIRWIPSLLVHSDDVEAWHAARIERVSDDKMYYLRARGVPKNDATILMIQSYVMNVFEGMDVFEKNLILERVLKMF